MGVQDAGEKEMNKQYTYYPSSAAFQWGNLTKTRYNNGCVRFIFLSQLVNYQKDFPEKQAHVGATHETWFANNHDDQPFQREVEVKYPIDLNTRFSGKIDFLFKDYIVETKATFNKRRRMDVIRNGKWQLSHLAQICTYMDIIGVERGYIVVGYYEPNKDGNFEHVEARWFDVRIVHGNEIFVDGKLTLFTISQLEDHQKAVVHAFDTYEIPERPEGADGPPFKNPCHYCPFKGACEDYENGYIKKDLKSLQERIHRNLKEDKT